MFRLPLLICLPDAGAGTSGRECYQQDGGDGC